MTDPLNGLQQAVTDLAEAPVASHPDVLESVHRAIVTELEGLAGAGSQRDRRSQA